MNRRSILARAVGGVGALVFGRAVVEPRSAAAAPAKPVVTRRKPVENPTARGVYEVSTVGGAVAIIARTSENMVAIQMTIAASAFEPWMCEALRAMLDRVDPKNPLPNPDAEIVAAWRQIEDSQRSLREQSQNLLKRFGQ